MLGRFIWTSLILLQIMICSCKDAPKSSEFGDRSEYVPPDTSAEVPPQSLVVFPEEVTLAEGETVNYYLAAVYPDGSRKQVSEGATFAFSEENIASMDLPTMTATAQKNGETRLTFSFKGLDVVARIVVKKAVLYNIEVGPASGPFHAGQLVQLQAKGIYSNHKSVDISDVVHWTIEDTKFAKLADGAGKNGQLSLLTVGVITLHAELESIKSDLQMTIDGAQIDSLVMMPSVISLPIGAELELPVSALYTDKTLIDVKTQTAWTMADNTIASLVIHNGINYVKVLAEGMTTITGVLGDKQVVGHVIGLPAKLTSIAITPTSPSVPLGSTTKLLAKGTYSNGNEYDITSIITWTSSVPTVATVGNGGTDGGKLITNSIGNTVIGATFDGISTSTTLTVASAEVVSISLSTTSLSIVKGLTANLAVTANYSNGTTSNITSLCTYKSSNPGIASVTNDPGNEGKVTGANAGTTKITATFGAFSGIVNVTTTAAQLVSLAVTPALPSVPKGRSQVFVAMGTYTDGMQVDLTQQVLWSADYSQAPNSNVAWMTTSPGYRGQANTTAMGTIAIRAEMNGLNASTTLTVTQKMAIDLVLAPGSGTALDVGTQQQFTSTVVYTDGTTMDATSASSGGYLTTWTNADPSLLDLNFSGVGASKALSEGLVSLSVTTVTPDGTFTRFASISVQSKCVSGTRYSYWCWYKSALNQSCDDVCIANGANYHSATASYLGSGYGCGYVNSALGGNGILNSDNVDNTSSINKGLGCSIFNPNFNVRVTNPPPNSYDADPNFKRICACTQ